MSNFREWFTAQFDKLTPDFSKIVDSIINIPESIKEKFKTTLADIWNWMEEPTINKFKEEVAIKSINEDLFQSEEIKTEVKKLKEKWKHSPSDASGIANDLLEVFKGRAAKLQAEAILGKDIPDEYTTLKNLFWQMGIIGDIQVGLGLVNMIAEIFTIGQVDKISDTVQNILNSYGISQITDFGYGMILNTILSPLIEKEINQITTPHIIDTRTANLLWYRGLIEDKNYMDIMNKWGYNNEQTKNIKRSYLYYPSPTDLITLMGREAFEEDIISSYNLDAGWDRLDKSWLEKGGVTEDWGRKLWVAHWEHASWYRLREGINRGFISESTLDDWMMLRDVAPYWKELYHALLARPITRVDIRRLYEDGLLSADELKIRYRDLGYSDADATMLVDWTKIHYNGDERELTKSNILESYRKQIYDQTKVKGMLQNIGYPKEEADFLLTLEEYKLYREQVEEEAKLLVDEYSEGKIEQDVFEKGIKNLFLTENEKKAWKIKAERERRKAVKIPSKADVEDWFKKDLIKEQGYKDKMSAIGYKHKDIELYLKAAKKG